MSQHVWFVHRYLSAFLITVTVVSLWVPLTWAGQLLVDPGPSSNEAVFFQSSGSPAFVFVRPFGEIVSVEPTWVVTPAKRLSFIGESIAPFDCLGDCTDGHWQIEAGEESIPHYGSLRYTWFPLLETNAIEFIQDSTAPEIECRELSYVIGASEPIPLGAFGNPDGPAGVIPEEQRRPLGEIEDLIVTFYHKVISAEHGTRCGAPRDLASTMVSLTFRNKGPFFPPSVERGTTLLQYNIVTYDSRNASFDGFWYREDSSGVSDDIDVYGLPRREPGGTGYLYAIDVAERVKELLENNPGQLDPDLSRWKLTGFSSGSYTNGEAQIHSVHSMFSVSDDG